MLFEDRIPEEDVPISEEKIDFYVQYMNEYKKYKMSLIDEISNLYNNAKLLEAFSGMGYIGIDILKSNPNLTLIAVESDEKLIRKYKDNVFEAKLLGRWYIVKGAMEDIPFKKEYFEITVSANTLHHWKNPLEVIKEILRVTKKGGYIFINDLRRDANENIVEVIIRDLHSKGTPGANWFLRNFLLSLRASYTKEEIEEIANMAGIITFEVFRDGPVSITLKAVKGGNTYE